MRGTNRSEARLATGILSLLPLFCVLTCISPAQNKPDQNSVSPHELVRRVVANEVKAEQQDHSHWKFRLDTKKPNGQTEADEVVEAKDGDLKRPMLINGHPLSAQQQQKADHSIQQLLHDPGAIRKARTEEDQDTVRSQRLLKMLPDAFLFKYGQRRGNLVEFNFYPNPAFHPPNHEAEVFHAMSGTLAVDAKQQRVEEINGRLMHEVKFGGGLLGHLNQGGTFQVKQAQVSPSYWELTLLHVNMKGKALFFKTIGVQQNYTRSDFKQVADDLTLTKAAEILKGQKETAEVLPHR